MIFLFGANELALTVAAELDLVGESYEILLDENYYTNDSYKGIKISVSNKIKFNNSDTLINCVGYRDLFSRREIANRYKLNGVISTYISPRANIGPKVQIGLGSVVLADSYIERGSIIGEGCILWHKSHVCHDAEIGSYSFLAAGSIVGGNSKIPNFFKLGFNSVIEEQSYLNHTSSLSPGALAFVKKNGSIIR